MAENIRSTRFCQEDLTGVAVYPDAHKTWDENSGNTVGYPCIDALQASDEEIIEMLKEDKRNDRTLQQAWQEAKDTLNMKKDYKHLNSLSPEAKLAVRTFTIESPFYKKFNSKSRTIITSDDWENFPYKGMFLLLFDAVISLSGECQPTTLYRGMGIKTKIEVGTTIKFTQFTSTTSERSVATQGFGGNQGTLFILSDVTHALEISRLSAIPEEEEYLVYPNDAYKVKETKKNGQVLEIYLESAKHSVAF